VIDGNIGAQIERETRLSWICEGNWNLCKRSFTGSLDNWRDSMLSQITREIRHLEELTTSAYFTGSQLHRENPERDVDMLFILNGEDKISFDESLKKIQMEPQYLLHPTVITKAEFRRNPHYQTMVKGGRKIW
jgi:hypothetical protein